MPITEAQFKLSALRGLISIIRGREPDPEDTRVTKEFQGVRGEGEVIRVTGKIADDLKDLVSRYEEEATGNQGTLL